MLSLDLVHDNDIYKQTIFLTYYFIFHNLICVAYAYAAPDMALNIKSIPSGCRRVYLYGSLLRLDCNPTCCCKKGIKSIDQ